VRAATVVRGEIAFGNAADDHLGEHDAAKAVVQAIETVLGQEKLRTRDLGGGANTVICGKAIADALS